MKKLYLIVALCFGICSCQKNFYQVSTVKSDNLNETETELVFENNDCKISYNFWSENGNSGFIFQNKTDKNIYLNLGESFYVFNNHANDYFKNRTYTTGQSVGVSVSNGAYMSNSVANSVSASGAWVFDRTITVQASTGASKQIGLSKQVGVRTESKVSIEVKEEMIVCIPPHSYKIFKEYNVTEKIHRECGYKLFPSRNEVKALRFELQNSPVKFKNVITYNVGDNDRPIVLENNFYVSSIINYTDKLAIIKERITHDCMGKKKVQSREISSFKDAAPNKFYIKYSKTFTSEEY